MTTPPPVVISVTVPAAVATRVIAALCAAGGYPVTPTNAQKAVLDYITATVRNVELSQAQQTAVTAVTWSGLAGLS